MSTQGKYITAGQLQVGDVIKKGAKVTYQVVEINSRGVYKLQLLRDGILISNRYYWINDPGITVVVVTT